MIFENFSVEEVASAFDELQARRDDGFSAEEANSEGLTASCDIVSSVLALANFNTNGVNYGSYNDGLTVYVTGATDSYVDLSIQSYYITAMNIDASNSSGYNLLGGNFAHNVILGGAYRNFLWGGNDYVGDTLIGGTGENLFGYGRYQGDDAILNASSNDGVYLQGLNLSDIVATAVDGNTIGLLFNTGNVLTVACTELQSPEFMLNDDGIYQYNFLSATWSKVDLNVNALLSA